MSKEFDLGYLVGLIVGEGSFTGNRRDPCLSVKLHEDDPLPLLKLKAMLGGQIYGPYHYRGKDGTIRSSRTWHLRGRALEKALPLIAKSLPASRKREQFEVWLDKYKLRSLAGTSTQLHLLSVEHSRKHQKFRVVKNNDRQLSIS